jgi:anaerobic magnesium-protoporphyrin IX monomethyl ester cyclase
MKSLYRVRGISFWDRDEVVRTEARPLIDDLDELPFPAYDLLPMQKYGRNSRNHRAFAAIELSRGCTQKCSFCILRRQMGRYLGPEVRPCLRTKSAERAFEEIRILNDRFGRRYLGWVDPCFNADSNVLAQVSELLLRSGRHIGQSEWAGPTIYFGTCDPVRSNKCAQAGLNELYVVSSVLTKPNSCLWARNQAMCGKLWSYGPSTARTCLPLVLCIYGLPGDTPRVLRTRYWYSYSLPLNLNFFIPLTPLPGTSLWDPRQWDGSWE